ncbi:MAG TPA: hypothetical protein VGM82_23625 [Gemmatimonadaceae bacterium]|jgi:hypothetical protein
MLTANQIFAVDGETYGWCEVVVAAARNGAWADAERRARIGAAADAHAAATNDPFAPRVLDAAAREFRYARDLVSADSMERWLASRNVSLKEWSAYLRRSLNSARFAGEAGALLQRYPIGADEAARVTLSNIVCSGELGEWKQSLASRVAAAGSLGWSLTASDAEETSFPDILFPALPLLGVTIDDIRAAVRRLQNLDDAFERFRTSQITDAMVGEYVGRRRLDWVQFDCGMMAFPVEDMAAEAALLLREDGMELTGVYDVASVEPREARFWLEDIPAETRSEFLAAQTGDLLGPMRIGDEYALYLIREKTLPSARDPEVRRRAEEGVLRHALRHQLDHRVHWLAD